MLQNTVLQSIARSNISEERAMLEDDEAVVVSGAAKLRMLTMRVLNKSTEHEDLRMKVVDTTIVSGVLHERRPRVDSPASPWAKSCVSLRDSEVGALRHCTPLIVIEKSHCVKIKNLKNFPSVKGLHDGLKESVSNDNASNKVVPQSCVVAMESFEACNSVLSTQKKMIDENQESKRKLASDAKDVETQHEIGETNFITLPRPSKILKHSASLGLEADPTTSSSWSSTMSAMSNEKPSPEEKNSLQHNHLWAAHTTALEFN